MQKPRVLIVVLNYNGEECLLDTLYSLKQLQYPQYQVLVVDNGSTDTSLERAQEKFPSFEYLPLSKNKGFAGGMNEGIRYAEKEHYEYVWLFNYDATAAPDALDILVTIALEKDLHIMSPSIIHSSGRSWFEGGKIDTWRMRALHVPNVGPVSPYCITEYVTGCALFLSLRLVREVGFLDERFFLYYEDAEYSRRAVRHGFAPCVVSGARVIHGERSEEGSSKLYYLVYSGLVFFELEDNWWERLYHKLYVTIRKSVNKWKRLQGKKEAFLVQQAYEDFQRDRSAGRFSRVRKLQ